MNNYTFTKVSKVAAARFSECHDTPRAAARALAIINAHEIRHGRGEHLFTCSPACGPFVESDLPSWIDAEDRKTLREKGY